MAKMDYLEMFGHSSSESVQYLEREIGKVLSDLKEELSEIRLTTSTDARPFSTVRAPHDIEFFRKEKQSMIERTLKVSQAYPMVKQAEILKEEMMNAEKPEYSAKSIPLLLNQHFTDRIYQLMQCKHQHLMRWKRFSKTTKDIENAYPDYSDRVRKIISEFEDSLSRAHRLSTINVSKVKSPSQALMHVKMDDLLIYLRWLICHLNSTKKFNQFLKILQWFPVSYKNKFSARQFSEDKFEHQQKPVNRLSVRYEAIKSGQKNVSPSTGTFSDILKKACRIKDPQVHAMSTQPMPSSVMPWALGFLGGGRCSNDLTLEIPVHSLKFHDFKNQLKFLANRYGIECKIDNIKNLKDEMTLYLETYKKFVTIFAEQEATWKFPPYDTGEPNQKMDRLIKKQADWIPFIKLKPERNTYQEKEWAELRQEQQKDVLLEQQAKFFKVNDPEKTMAILQKHTAILSEETSTDTINQNNEKYLQKTEALWKKIYSTSNMSSMKVGMTDGDLNDDEEEVGEENSKLQKFQSGFSYTNTIKMLGLDSQNKGGTDSVMTNSAYLSLLFLRHLRVRDLRYSCLLSLNYFRSIERTLTINDVGLSFEGGKLTETSPQNHRNLIELKGTLGGGGGLGNSGYLYNTPADFKMSETDFLEDSDAASYEDFYEIKDGDIYVQDQNGYYIMYDATINDLNALEEDLLLLGSHYIDKDKNVRNIYLTNRRKFLMNEEVTNNFLINEYPFLHIDRFGILLDFWTQEVSFQNCKRELIRCYFEAYLNVFDRDERRLLAQTITQIIHQRPRFHPQYTQYFNNIYFNECINLHLHTSLITDILNQQIEDQRNYIANIKDEMHGLPWKTIKQFPMAIHSNESALKPLYLLEFHPSFALASRIPKALDFIEKELTFLACVDDSENVFVIERNILEIALKEWRRMKTPGLSFSEEVQRDLFFDSFVENASLMGQMAASMINPIEYGSSSVFNHQHVQMVEKIQSVIEVVNLRHRLIEAAWETEILSEQYKKQARNLSFGEHHLHLRVAPFELTTKEVIKKKEPVDITTALEDDPSIDRYIPKNLQLAIHEYDVAQLGQFCFKSKGTIEELLKPNGIQKLRVVLKCQICQRNALIACVQQVYFCHYNVIKAEKCPLYKTKTVLDLESRVTRFRENSKIFESEKTNETDIASEESEITYAETFVSLQLEKLPIRDMMLNRYLIDSKGIQDTDMQQSEICKRSLLSTFCDDFFTQMSQYSLRNQLTMYYSSLKKILNRFPIIRQTYFLVGTYKKELPGLTHEPENRDKNKQVLSSDGKTVCNIWYLPHPTEVVRLFRKLDVKSRIEALTHMLEICSALHDLVHYIFAHVELGNKHVKFFTGVEESSVDSGGVEGIKSQFHEIQAQIQSLSSPTCPVLVAELLTLRRNIIFLEFDLSLRHSVTETFLMSGNRAAYEALSNNMDISLTLLSDAKRDSVFNMYLKVPEPLEASDEKSKSLFPWRNFLGCNGPYPTMFWPFHLIGYYVQLCMSGLKDVDRTIASGEILGVSLTMEDMLLSEFPSIKELRRDSMTTFEPVDITSLSTVAKKVLSKRALMHKASYPRLSVDFTYEDPVDEEGMQKVDPIDIYTLLLFCLLLWKQLEIVKQEWVSLWQDVISGDPIDNYHEICKIYRQEVMFPVLQSLARKYNQIDLYVGIAQISDPLIIPKGTSELEVKICQLQRILENLDYQMTRNILKKVRQDLSLAVAERSREEMILPTDLWRGSVSSVHGLNEPITLTYPTIMMDFRDKLLSEVQSSCSDGTLSFTEEHLTDSLQSLAQSITERERYTYKSYTGHYQKFVKSYHDKLYRKEQEIDQIKENQNAMDQRLTAAVECQMAENTFHLLIEITRLRHEIEELNEKNMEKKTAVHEEVREDYSKLVENFFLASSELREKFDVFRHELKDDVMDKITTVRRQAVEEMEKVRSKYNLPIDQNNLELKLSKAEEVRLLQADNVQLNILLLKLRTINTWRQNFSQANYMKAINKLMKDVNKLKRENIKLNLMSSKENQLLREQVTALQQELGSLVKGFASVRTQLDTELRVKEEKLHKSKQIYEYEQQIEHVKQEHMDKLLEELNQKEMQLRRLNSRQEESRANSAEGQNKNVVSSLKKFLEQERTLKLKAFQEVDYLRCMVDRLETPSVSKSRPKSSIPLRGYKAKSRQSCSQSATLPRQSVSEPQPSVQRPTRTVWEKKRPQTVDPKDGCPTERRKMIQRPKTVTGYMRSYLSNQLTTQEDLYALSDILDSMDK